MREATKIILSASLQEAIDKWLASVCEDNDYLGYIPLSLAASMTRAAILVLEASAVSSQFTENEVK